ncbi:MAG TPA: M3 family oligoendopeptidase [Aliidongia sp.]|nr:M3 family oligoendopeptidase [Aliidongia sp.]
MNFSDISVATPTKKGLEARYQTIATLLDGGTPAGRERAVAEWDKLRREYESWSALVGLKFQQDTQSPKAKADRDYADALTPEATGMEIAVKRRLLADPDRAGIEKLVGAQALRLWETDVTTFDPAITGDLELEAKVAARYTETIAGAKIAIDGKTVNLAGLEPYAQDLDRETRHKAEKLRWEFFAAKGEALDGIYDELVKLRHGMALKLGYSSYTELGYRRMRRVDYGPEDVARYRDQVVEHVVPLVAKLLEQRRRDFGYDRIHHWDEAVADPQGNPKPAGGHDFLVEQAETMFDRMDARLGDFYRVMRQGDLLDLKNRPTKAGGGFCTSFPTHGVPFIFANFNGTDHDVTVFTHEMGHAFQNWESRHQTGVDFLWPTYESAEIHSMSMEFLSHPQLGLLVGEAEADRFRRLHLIQSLSFLPYGVCVDHFQHLVYERPYATPAERHLMWQELERRYMPWRDYGDLAYPAKGGLWQAKLHIYRLPFYYIDYTLASCCAMQFWVKSLKDYGRAFEDYVALCGRGGSAPFQDLVRSAGLVSPFAPGALSEVVGEAARQLAA